MCIYMNFSNNFITANNQDEPDILRIFDSDGEFIDYIDYDFWLREMPESFYDFLQLFTGNEDLDWEVADTLKNFFDSIDNVVYDIDSEKLEKLYEIHGKEFVNRVGTCALIMKE